MNYKTNKQDLKSQLNNITKKVKTCTDEYEEQSLIIEFDEIKEKLYEEWLKWMIKKLLKN